MSKPGRCWPSLSVHTFGVKLPASVAFAAEAAGLAPLKVNMVVKRGLNDHEIVPMARHFRGSGHILQCRTIRHQTPLKRFSLQHKCHAILTRPASQSQTNSFHSKIIRIISSGKSFLGSVFCILATFCLK